MAGALGLWQSKFKARGGDWAFPFCSLTTLASCELILHYPKLKWRS